MPQHGYKTANMLDFLGFLIHNVERYSFNSIKIMNKSCKFIKNIM